MTTLYCEKCKEAQNPRKETDLGFYMRHEAMGCLK